MNSKHAVLLCVLILALPPALQAQRKPDVRGFDGAAFEHSFSRADRELSADTWMEEARRGLGAARVAWERMATALYGDAAELSAASEQVGRWTEEELELRFAAWLQARFFAPGTAFLFAPVAAQVDAANRAYLYKTDASGRMLYDEAGADPLVVRPEDGGLANLEADRETWRRGADGLADALVSDYRASLASAFPELLAYISEERRESFSTLLSSAAAAAAERGRRELDALIRREERLFIARRTGDVWSLRKKSESEAAAAIAAALVRDTQAACDQGIASLQTRIEAAAGGAGDLALAGSQWLEAYREQFQRGLDAWTKAEERFMLRRIEWEREAGKAFASGEEAWASAFAKLEAERRVWETKAKALFEQGEEIFRRASETLELAIAEAKAEFQRDADLRAQAGADRARAWVDSYLTCGSVVVGARESVNYWLSKLAPPGTTAPEFGSEGLDEWIDGRRREKWAEAREVYGKRGDFLADTAALAELKKRALWTREEAEQAYDRALYERNQAKKKYQNTWWAAAKPALKAAWDAAEAHLASMLPFVTSYESAHASAVAAWEAAEEAYPRNHALWFDLEAASRTSLSEDESALMAGRILAALGNSFDQEPLAAAREAKRWMALHGDYIVKALQARDALAEDFALAIGSGALADALDPAASGEDFHLDEYQIELLRAKAVAGYWSRRVEIAEAVDAYARDLTAGRVTDAESVEAWKRAKTAYDGALAAYAEAQRALSDAGNEVAAVRNSVAQAAAALSEADRRLEALNADYALKMASYMTKNNDFILAALVDRYRELLELRRLSYEKEGAEARIRYLEKARELGFARELQEAGLELQDLVRGAGGEPSLDTLRRRFDRLVVPSSAEDAVAPEAFGLIEGDESYGIFLTLAADRNRLLDAAADAEERSRIRETYGALLLLAVRDEKRRAETELLLRMDALSLLAASSSESWYAERSASPLEEEDRLRIAFQGWAAYLEDRARHERIAASADWERLKAEARTLPADGDAEVSPEASLLAAFLRMGGRAEESILGRLFSSEKNAAAARTLGMASAYRRTASAALGVERRSASLASLSAVFFGLGLEVPPGSLPSMRLLADVLYSQDEGAESSLPRFLVDLDAALASAPSWIQDVLEGWKGALLSYTAARSFHARRPPVEPLSAQDEILAALRSRWEAAQGAYGAILSEPQAPLSLVLALQGISDFPESLPRSLVESEVVRRIAFSLLAAYGPQELTDETAAREGLSADARSAHGYAPQDLLDRAVDTALEELRLRAALSVPSDPDHLTGLARTLRLYELFDAFGSGSNPGPVDLQPRTIHFLKTTLSAGFSADATREELIEALFGTGEAEEYPWIRSIYDARGEDFGSTLEGLLADLLENEEPLPLNYVLEELDDRFRSALAPLAAYRDTLRSTLGGAAPMAERLFALHIASRAADAAYLRAVLDILDPTWPGNAEELFNLTREEGFDALGDVFLRLEGSGPYAADAALYRLKSICLTDSGAAYDAERERFIALNGPASAALIAEADRFRSLVRDASLYEGPDLSGPLLQWALDRHPGDAEAAYALARYVLSGCADDPLLMHLGRGLGAPLPGDPVTEAAAWALGEECRNLEYQTAGLSYLRSYTALYEGFAAQETETHWRMYMDADLFSKDRRVVAADLEPLAPPGAPEDDGQLVRGAASWSEGLVADEAEAAEKESANFAAALGLWTAADPEAEADSRSAEFRNSVALFLNDPAAAWDGSSIPNVPAALVEALRSEAAREADRSTREQSLRRELKRLGSAYCAAQDQSSLQTELDALSAAITAQRAAHLSAVDAYAEQADLFRDAGVSYEAAYAEAKIRYAELEAARRAYEQEDAIRRWASSSYLESSGDSVPSGDYRSPAAESAYSKERLSRSRAALDALTDLYSGSVERRPYADAAYAALYERYRESFGLMMLAVKARDAVAGSLLSEYRKNGTLHQRYSQAMFGGTSRYAAPLSYPDEYAVNTDALGFKDILRVADGRLSLAYDGNYSLAAVDEAGMAALKSYFEDPGVAGSDTQESTAFERAVREWNTRMNGYNFDTGRYRTWGLARDYLVRRLRQANPWTASSGAQYNLASIFDSHGMSKIPDNRLHEFMGPFRNNELVVGLNPFSGLTYETGLPGLQRGAWEGMGAQERADLEFYVILTLTGSGGAGASALSRLSALVELERNDVVLDRRYRYYRKKKNDLLSGWMYKEDYARVAEVYDKNCTELYGLRSMVSSAATNLRSAASSLAAALTEYRRSCDRIARIEGKSKDGAGIDWETIRVSLVESGAVEGHELAVLSRRWEELLGARSAKYESVSAALDALASWSRTERDDLQRELEQCWAEDEGERKLAETEYRALQARYIETGTGSAEFAAAAQDAYGTVAAARKNHLEHLDEALRGTVFGLLGTESAYTREYVESAHDYAGLIGRAYRARLEAELAAREAEWEQQRRDLAQKRSAWRSAAGLILDRGREDWFRGFQLFRERYSTWSREFSEKYRETDAAWTAFYLEGLDDKHRWVLRATEAADEAAGAAILALVGSDAEAMGRKFDTLGPLSDFDAGKAGAADAVREVLASSGISFMADAFGSASGSASTAASMVRRGVGGLGLWNAAQAQVAAGAFAGKTNEELAARQARILASRARDAAEAAVRGLEENLAGANQGFRESMDELFVLSGHWRRNGNNYSKDVASHSTFFDPMIYESAHVRGYIAFVMSPWKLETDLSDGSLENLTAFAVELLIAQAQKEVEKRSEEIFGGTNRDDDEELKRRTKIVETWRTRRVEMGTKKERRWDKDGNSYEVEVPVYGYERYEDTDARITKTWGAGAFGAHIGYDPVVKEGADPEDGVETLWRDAGTGELGRLMREYIYWSMVEGKGLAELGKPSWDKSLWDDRGSWFKAPTLRTVADVGVAIAATALVPGGGLAAMAAAATINLADDAVFTMLDVSGGYRSWEASGTEFGKKALSSAASAAMGGVFNGFDGVGEGIFKAGGLNAGFSSLSGMPGVIAKTTMTGMQSLATSTVTSAINAIQWDGKGLLWSSDAFNAGMQAGLVNAAVGMTSTFTAGSLGQMNLFDGIRNPLTDKVFNTASIANFNSFAGSLAGQGMNFALGGDFTLNLLNASDLSGGKLKGGLLELHLGRGGVSMNMGMGGADASFGTIAASMSGLRDTLKIGSAKTAALFGGLTGVSTLNAVNMLGYSQDTNNFALGRNIWSNRLKVKYGDTGDDLGYYDSNNADVVMFSKDLLGGGREAAAKLATVMAHEGTHVAGNRYESEAHKQGLLIYGSLLSTFGLQGDQDFALGMVAALMNPDSYQANMENIDHWKLTNDGKLVYDGQGYLKDGAGKYINKDGSRSDKPGANTIGAAGVETGLLNILNGMTSNFGYESFTEQQKRDVQDLMSASGLMNTVDLNNPANRTKWMWNGEGSYMDSVGGARIPIKVDVGALNEGKALRISALFNDFGNAYDRLLFDALPAAYAYAVLSENNRNTFGLANLAKDQYGRDQQTAAEAFRSLANGNATLPNVQPGVKDAFGNLSTWCNLKVFYDNNATLGPESYKSMLEPSGVGSTKANHLGLNLAANYPELSMTMAQHFANMGLQVRAAWIDPQTYQVGAADAPSGHVASVVANYGIFDPRLGPRISQAGLRNGEMWTSQGFGVARLPDVKYYWVMQDNFLKSLQYDNWWWRN